MNKKGDIEVTFYTIAILVFLLLLLGIVASIFISKNIDSGKSITDAYDERVSSLKTAPSVNIIKTFLILVIVVVIFYLGYRLKTRYAKIKRGKQRKSKKRK
jgi:uncharacterized protein HemY